MGLGPSTKMTTKFHMNCPVTRCVLGEKGADCAGVLVNGVSERYEDKRFTAERTGELAAALGADGALVITDGWGNHHIDFTGVIEALGRRGIPAVGLSYIGLQGRLVCTNPYVGTLIDFNKHASGYESCIVGDNNLDDLDALKAVKILLRQIAKQGGAHRFSLACPSAPIAQVGQAGYRVAQASMAGQTAFSHHQLTVDAALADRARAVSPYIEAVVIRILTPFQRHVRVNSNVDCLPVAVKTAGPLGQGQTRILDGLAVWVTAADSQGRQPHNIGSSEGFLDERVIFGQGGTPGKDDILLHIDVTLAPGEADTDRGIRAAHAAADTVVQAIRQAVSVTTDAPDRHRILTWQGRPGAPRLVIVKIVSALGAMYDTALFPYQPAGFLGSRCLFDGLQFPVFLTPLQVLDGAIHSMV